MTDHELFELGLRLYLALQNAGLNNPVVSPSNSDVNVRLGSDDVRRLVDVLSDDKETISE